MILDTLDSAQYQSPRPVCASPNTSVKCETCLKVRIPFSRGKLHADVCSGTCHCCPRLLWAARASWKCTLQTAVLGLLVTTNSPHEVTLSFILVFVQLLNTALFTADTAFCCLSHGHLNGRNARVRRGQTIIAIEASARVTLFVSMWNCVYLPLL